MKSYDEKVIYNREFYEYFDNDEFVKCLSEKHNYTVKDFYGLSAIAGYQK